VAMVESSCWVVGKDVKRGNGVGVSVWSRDGDGGVGYGDGFHNMHKIMKRKIKVETMENGFGGKSMYTLAGFLDYTKDQGKKLAKKGGEGREAKPSICLEFTNTKDASIK